jgi:hypothetical protein
MARKRESLITLHFIRFGLLVYRNMTLVRYRAKTVSRTTNSLKNESLWLLKTLSGGEISPPATCPAQMISARSEEHTNIIRAVRVELQFKQHLGSEISRCNVASKYMIQV